MLTACGPQAVIEVLTGAGGPVAEGSIDPGEYPLAEILAAAASRRGGHQLPEDWRPTADDIAFADCECGLRGTDLERHIGEFITFWTSGGGVMADWDAAFRHRCYQIANSRARRETKAERRKRLAAANLARVHELLNDLESGAGAAPDPDGITVDEAASDVSVTNGSPVPETPQGPDVSGEGARAGRLFRAAWLQPANDRTSADDCPGMKRATGRWRRSRRDRTVS